MHLIEEYKKQYQWRSWNTVYEQLPNLNGQTLLDLGCSIGDQAADFIERGARVIGIDSNDDLLKVARSRFPKHHRFINSDIRKLPDIKEPVDGIWCSFAVAYMIDFTPVLYSWKKHLKEGGWIALTEIDNFFGHEPLSKHAKTMLQNYARDAYTNKRYDFNMGRKLEDYVRNAGFNNCKSFTLEDKEFSFSGPASTEVISAWENRLERMKLLHGFCSSSYENVKSEFLSCLKQDTHRSLCKVFCCIAFA